MQEQQVMIDEFKKNKERQNEKIAILERLVIEIKKSRK